MLGRLSFRTSRLMGPYKFLYEFKGHLLFQ